MRCFPVIFLVLAVLCCGCSRGNNLYSGEIRTARVAGAFYPADSSVLKQMVEGYLLNAWRIPISGKIIGLISPHAGYIYSGAVAAWSYKQLTDEYTSVVILAPSHVKAFNYASIFNGTAYETPLGRIPVDRALAEELASRSRWLKLSSEGHLNEPYERPEHSLEVQLPFLQIVLKDFSVVPIVIGTQNWNVLRSLGNVLGTVLRGRKVLLVASSDLSHYQSYEECNQIDKRLIDCLLNYDPYAFIKGIAEGTFEACGAGPITSLLIATRILGGSQVQVLKHANSGDIPGGDHTRVVGYLSAIIIGGEMEANDSLSLDEKRFLMKLAQESVRAAVEGEAPPAPKDIPERLRENRGAFVTLKKHGYLRGCIGYVLPVKPLYQTVIDVARSAALNDPRFPEVSEQELPELEYEISVLTVPRTIKSIDEIQVGKHGLIIRKGFYQGLLLPQVATEYGWDREEFLRNTCRKAGLPENAWKDEETEIQIFSAQVFDEESLR